MSQRVLLLQPDMKPAVPLARYFTSRGDQVWQAWELNEGETLLEQVRPHLLLMDLHFSSTEWINFLRRVRHDHPEIQVIMTNKYPDLQREMMAREQNVHVFLRQPFAPRWIEQALDKLEGDDATRPVGSKRKPAEDKKAGSQAPLRPVRVPVRVKITLPYLLLAIMFAVVSGYIVGQVVLESIQDRFINSLIETGKQSTDWMVREENRLLETLRLIANTQGVADAVQRQDAEALRGMVLPVAVNASEEAVEILSADGAAVLSLRRAPGGGAQDYSAARGETFFQQQAFIQRVQRREIDSTGDKYASLVRAPWGDYFYISGPILDANGNLVGMVVVGKSLHTLVRQMQQETLGEATLYDPSGTPLASTLFNEAQRSVLDSQRTNAVLGSQDHQSLTRELEISGLKYTEILAPWEVRGGADQGVLGVSLVQSFLMRTSQVTKIEIIALVALAILFVLVVGLYLANLITRPLLRLVSASSEVAQGNLEIKVDANGDDEVAFLAQSFNYMVAGLQEGSIYRDLLGRTVSPEVREQLRQTFTSGKLRLEGQQAVATVIMTDIRGFTPISEKADPSTVFQWLNEYFAHMVPVVAAHGGVVNKFDGDAMLAFFGILPRMLNPRQSAVAACESALEIFQAVNRLNELRRARGEPLMVTGIGINTGLVMAGGLGTSDRMHYTIIGDTVNTTQRIEALTREVLVSSGVLVSQSTVSALGEDRARFNLVPMGEYNVKGKEDQVFVYLLIPSEGRGMEALETLLTPKASAQARQAALAQPLTPSTGDLLAGALAAEAANSWHSAGLPAAPARPDRSAALDVKTSPQKTSPQKNGSRGS